MDKHKDTHAASWAILPFIPVTCASLASWLELFSKDLQQMIPNNKEKGVHIIPRD